MYDFFSYLKGLNIRLKILFLRLYKNIRNGKSDEDIYEQITTLAEELYKERKISLSEKYGKLLKNVVPIMPPGSVYTVDLDKLYEKAEKKKKIAELKSILNRVPSLKPKYLYLTFTIMLVSFMANVYFINSTLGDWLSGQEGVSILVNFLIALLITVAEYVAPFAFLLLIKDEGKRVMVAKYLGMAGAVVAIVGLLIIILSRGEIVSNLMNNTGSVGGVLY